MIGPYPHTPGTVKIINGPGTTFLAVLSLTTGHACSSIKSLHEFQLRALFTVVSQTLDSE